MQKIELEIPIRHLFDVLNGLLQAGDYRSAKARQILLKLITQSETTLSNEKTEHFEIFQKYLLHKDLEVQKSAYLALSFAILRADPIMNKIADDNMTYEDIANTIQKFIKNKETVLDLSDEDLSGLDVTSWQAFCTALSTSKIT